MQPEFKIHELFRSTLAKPINKRFAILLHFSSTLHYMYVKHYRCFSSRKEYVQGSISFPSRRVPLSAVRIGPKKQTGIHRKFFIFVGVVGWRDGAG